MTLTRIIEFRFLDILGKTLCYMDLDMSIGWLRTSLSPQLAYEDMYQKVRSIFLIDKYPTWVPLSYLEGTDTMRDFWGDIFNTFSSNRKHMFI